PGAPGARCPTRRPAPPPGSLTARLGRVHGRRPDHSRARRPSGPHCAAPARGDLNELATRFALRLVEVLSGVRPAGQLSRHTTHTAYGELTRLVQRGTLRAGPGQARPVVRRVYDSAPAPGVLEVCARVESGARSRMVVFRLERHPRSQQWQCAALDTR
uniref:Rv3235 family protein n=1 Tax=Peterkaempfera griseoplana TaxID=66896 RepID=UPI0006E2B24B